MLLRPNIPKFLQELEHKKAQDEYFICEILTKNIVQ